MTNRKTISRGFTLAEVIIATTLTVVVMGGVTSSMLMFTKLGYRTEQYTELENETRRCLDFFGTDARSAKKATWNSLASITLAVVTDDIGTSKNVTYAFDAAAKTLTRTEGAQSRVIVSGIENFAFNGFNSASSDTAINYDPLAPNLTTLTNNTRQIQLSLSARRTRSTQIQTDQKVVSARFILRNK